MSSLEPQSGPSRLPTISSEAEEEAAEAGVVLGSATNGRPIGDGDDSGTNGHAEGAEGPNGDGEGPGPAEAGTKRPDPNALPDEACETIYIQNLNEKVRLPVLTATLASLFKPYRPVLPVVAHKNVRMRGQAFVSFHDRETAERARKEVNEFPLYGKPMQLSFARTRADSVVKRVGGASALEEHKKNRLEAKKRSRRDNPLRRKALAKLRADETGTVPAKKARLQMPDEYLPPNNVLFVQNLPEGTTSDDLREVFELHAGLVEIRTIPAKKDIAFVEYADEGAATLAKDALHNFKIDGETKMKVTYAKK